MYDNKQVRMRKQQKCMLTNIICVRALYCIPLHTAKMIVREIKRGVQYMEV